MRVFYYGKDPCSCPCWAGTAKSHHWCGLVTRHLRCSESRTVLPLTSPESGSYFLVFTLELKSQASEIGQTPSHACALWKVKFRTLPGWDWAQKAENMLDTWDGCVMPPCQVVHVPILGTWGYVTLHGKRDFADEMKLRTLRWEGCSGLSRWA